MNDQREQGCRCQSCGNRFKVDVLVPDELWERIKPAGKPTGGGLLCDQCIFGRIEALRECDALAFVDVDTATEIRRYLWLTHGHEGIYGDDGEMQCAECRVYGCMDYKRDDLSKVIHAASKARFDAGLEEIAKARAAGWTPELGIFANAALGYWRLWTRDNRNAPDPKKVQADRSGPRSFLQGGACAGSRRRERAVGTRGAHVSDKSSIEWTDATWNPTRGCSRVSTGCTRCYAERVAARFSGPGMPYEGLARRAESGEPRWTGEVRFIEERLVDPLRWRTPRRVFVNSMSDLFHEDLPDAARDLIFAVMLLASNHTFQVLTKRPALMRSYVTGCQVMVINAACRLAPGWDGHVTWPLRNVWLGVSAENQATADERIPLLLQTPAAVRFVSAEPLLGPIDFVRWLDITYAGENGFQPVTSEGQHRRGLDWIIVGGESGPGARPMHPDWARSIRDQCQAAGVAFFFKQWGEWEPVAAVYHESDEAIERYERADTARCECIDLSGTKWPQFQPPSGSWWLERVGKRRAGRKLDGRTHDDMPALAR